MDRGIRATVRGTVDKKGPAQRQHPLPTRRGAEPRTVLPQGLQERIIAIAGILDIYRRESEACVSTEALSPALYGTELVN